MSNANEATKPAHWHKTKEIRARVTPRLYARFENLASESELSMSELLRELISRATMQAELSGDYRRGGSQLSVNEEWTLAKRAEKATPNGA